MATNNTLNTRILLCNDTTANWADSTKVILKGEMAIEFTSSGAPKFKTGNGIDTFADLPYVTMTPSEITTAINNAITTASHSHSNKAVLDSIQVALTNALKTNYDAAYTHSTQAHAPSNAQANVIETVKVNGTALTPNSKAVDVTVPTKVSQLTNDAGYKTTDNNTTYDLGATASSANGNVKINLSGSDSTTDSVIVKGSGSVTVTTDANGAITVNGTDTKYSHPNSGVTAGTYKSVTVNAQGHVTAGTNPTTLEGYGITDAASSSALDDEIARATAKEDSLESNKANLASPTFTGTPKAPTAAAGTNDTQLATTAFVQNALSNGLAASDAMIIKGTIGTSGTVTALPTTYKTGWTYRVITAGTYAGQVCEVGDLIICLTSRNGSGNVDSDWCVAQTNINGAITGVKSGDAYITVSPSGSTVTITHKDVARSNTTSTASPAIGGTFTAIKSVTSDAKGHVTGVDTETVTLPKYTNGTGITISNDGVINHTNGVTAGTAQGDTNKTLSFGGTFLVPSVTYDAQGHITGKGTTTMTMPAAPTSVSGNSGSATKLQTARGIDGVTFDGTAAITHYAECSTAAATAAKTVALTGFTLATGSSVKIKFTATNTAASPTLNVNGTGAKAIMYRGSAIGAGYLATNRVYEFVYDGTDWELVGDINTDNDSKVTQTVTTTSADYPVLLAPTGQTTTVTTTSYFGTGLQFNPSTKTLTTNTFKGDLSGNAFSSTKLANARTIALGTGVTGTATSFDGSGNITIPVTSINAMYLNVGSTDTLILNGGGAI